MNIKLLKQLRTSVVLTGLLAGAMTISACQQQSDTEAGTAADAHAEEVPMSAEPAEPTDVVVDPQDTSNEVENDTAASVNTGTSQISYRCSPELQVEATYNEDNNQVTVATDMGTVTLRKNNEGSNPEVFEVATAIDGSEGLTQWRVAHEERETGVMRTAGADESDINTFECNEIS